MKALASPLTPQTLQVPTIIVSALLIRRGSYLFKAEGEGFPADSGTNPAISGANPHELVPYELSKGVLRDLRSAQRFPRTPFILILRNLRKLMPYNCHFTDQLRLFVRLNLRCFSNYYYFHPTHLVLSIRSHSSYTASE